MEIRPYEPLLDNPKLTANLQGQRFVVLRASRRLKEVYCELRARLREGLEGLPVTYPACPHVTLAGFAAGTPIGELQSLVASWAAGVPPLGLELEGLSVFPSPFQVVILEVRNTPPLVAAMARLRAASDRAGFAEATATPVDEWRFHISLAYCPELTEAQWRDVQDFVGTLPPPHGAEEVATAELVSFEDGECSGGAFALEAPPRREDET